MAITFPLALPTITGQRGITLRQCSTTALSRSPFTRQTQVQRHAGQWWEADITLPPMRRDSAEEWIAFLAALNGREGTFLMGDPVGATGRGTLTGTPLVKGAGQTGQDLLIDGASLSVTNWIRKGDWVQLGTGATSRLHKHLLDANSNGSGEVTPTLFPRLRAAPADNAAVTVASCKGVFRRADDHQAWSVDPAGVYTIAFKAEEAV